MELRSAHGIAVSIELSQLDRRHADLRIRSATQVSQLAAELAADGQRSPVLVTPGCSEHSYVLIDGFARVAALKRIGADAVSALIVPLDVAEALVFAYGLEHGRRRTPLEEGWLVRELTQQHGWPMARVTEALRRSTSWGSRRLSLVQQLPQSVQQLVRRGALGAHAAMRALVPLARANAEVAERLAAIAAREKLTSRELITLVDAWRQGTPRQRQHIEEHPLAVVRASRHVQSGTPQDEVHPSVVHDLKCIEAVARRCARGLADAPTLEPAVVAAILVIWPRARAALGDLTTLIEGMTHAAT